MSIGKYGMMNKECKKVPYLTAENMGSAWGFDLFKKRTRKQNSVSEVFFSIEHGSGEPQTHGYMQRSPALEEFFKSLIQDRRSNQHIEFVEWPDRYNCLVEDGIYNSQTNFFMTKEEFNKFENSIIPANEKGGGNYVG